MQCENPISIPVKNPLQKTKGETILVPCGKCPLCLRRKQREFAALAVLEASRSRSMHYLTLTYRNDCAPIAVSSSYGETVNFRFVDDPQEHAERVAQILNLDRSLGHYVVGEDEVTPSLRREDVRLWIKSARVAWKRLGKEVPNFVYAAFGEYGSTTFRPHYHLILLNSTREFTNFLCFRWNRDYGFTDFRDIPRVNKDGSNGFLKVAQYISKYIAKPKEVFPFLVDGVAEMPRRFASKGFGLNTIPIDSLKNFTYAKI